jgi:hypothetical protein
VRDPTIRVRALVSGASAVRAAVVADGAFVTLR